MARSSLEIALLLRMIPVDAVSHAPYNGNET